MDIECGLKCGFSLILIMKIFLRSLTTEEGAINYLYVFLLEAKSLLGKAYSRIINQSRLFITTSYLIGKIFVGKK